jgi:hypothetical protein
VMGKRKGNKSTSIVGFSSHWDDGVRYKISSQVGKLQVMGKRKGTSIVGFSSHCDDGVRGLSRVAARVLQSSRR